MIFKQVFDQKSSTYTYIIASAEGREALIIDPVLENVEDYIKLLTELNLKLVKVIDTHIHADHVTGAGKLRDKTQCVTIMGEHTPTDAVEIKVTISPCKFPNLCSTGIFMAKSTKSLSINGNRSSKPCAIESLSPTKNKEDRNVFISKYKELLI